MVAQTRTAGHSSPTKLKFHDKLTGKSLSTDALQKKLKALQTELASLEQDSVDTTSLNAVRKELISTSILLHRDRGVKAYTACCLADLLRLYAPDAPYTRNELGDIFAFFFRQLSSGLRGQDSPYYNEYFHLLESLSTVKSVVLVCDLPNADELMVDVFRSFFTMIRLDLAKKIELFMADILMALIDECQSLPHECLDTLLAQFLDTDTRMEQPAFRLAVQVCSQTADKLQRQVCQYFTDVIVSHSREEEFGEVQKAHTLIKRLNRSCPALLHNVVPQLEEELRVQQLQIRTMATQTLGEMFSEKNGPDFARKYPSTWGVWLARKNDQTPSLRLTWVEATKGLLVSTTQVEMRDQVEESLHGKLLDPDEKVRAAVCRLYGQIDYDTALHHVSEAQLQSIAGRMLDKKASVQGEAMKAIARLFNLAYPDIENADPAATKHFSWIPQHILHSALVTTDVKHLAQKAFADYILPLPPPNSKGGDPDEAVWTDRLLCVMRFLDTKAINVLLNYSNIKAIRPTWYTRYLQACIDNNGGVIDEDEEKVVASLNNTIKVLAAQFPDSHKSAEDLKTFAKLNENRLNKLLKTCLDPQTDLKSLAKSTHEFLKRLESSESHIVPTMATFLRRSTLYIVNQSSIPILIKRVAKGTEGAYQLETAQLAKIWLAYVSRHFPALYKQHVGELSKAIADEKNTQLVEASLQAYSVVVGWDEKLAPSDKRTLDRLQRFTLGTNRRHAKFAARLLALINNSDEVCTDVVESISDSLPRASPDQLVAHITVLQQFANRASDAFERQSDVIMEFVLRRVLMIPSTVPEDAMDIDEEWVDDAAMSPALRAKLLVLKTCRNRCMKHASAETALEIAKPVLNMFSTLLEQGGSFTSDARDDPKAKARLRLQAAVSLLHLATVPQFAKPISQYFVRICLTLQDPCYQVRMAFLNKLIYLLSARKLPPAYNVIPYIAVHDPESDIISMAKAYVQTSSKQMQNKATHLEYFEMVFLRLLHLLAHHPDFQLTEEAIPDIAKYIEFYLDLICNADNIGLLYHLAMKAKTIRDLESHAYSENLYAIAELAQHLIRARGKLHSWSIQSFPGKVKLPTDVFGQLPTAEAANKIVQTQYLPESILAWLAEKQPRQGAEKKQDRQKGERKAPVKRKAPAPKTNGQSKRQRKVKRRKDESEDEESESSEDDEEDEEDQDSGAEEQEADEDEEKENAQDDDDGSGSEKTSGEEGATRPKRGARTRAKAKIKQQAKKPTKTR